MKKTSITQKITDLFRKISTFYSIFINRLKIVPSAVSGAMSAALEWIKTSPENFKKWKNEDKKKKKYRSFRLQKKIKPDVPSLPSTKQLISSSVKFYLANWKLFVVIGLIHFAAYFVVLKTPQNILSIEEIQDTVSTVLGQGSENTWNGTLATLGTVLGVGGVVQANSDKIALAILLVSLVYVWAIRQRHNNHDVKARDAYYQGLAPILSVTIVLLVLAVQLIPAAVAGFAYSVARSSGIFITGFEDLAFFMATVIISLLSFYWVTSTVIALYVVSLPGMYPIKALRSAKKLVQFQRLAVFRRIIALPVILAVIYLLLLLTVIRFIPSATFYIVEGYQFLVLPILHIYLYKLYRALI